MDASIFIGVRHVFFVNSRMELSIILVNSQLFLVNSQLFLVHTKNNLCKQDEKNTRSCIFGELSIIFGEMVTGTLNYFWYVPKIICVNNDEKYIR